MKKIYSFLIVIFLVLSLNDTAYAMHISEGFLPPKWCGLYFILILPFIIIGIKNIRKKSENNKDIKMLIGLVAAYAFVLSAMKLPSVTGSSSHPTGTGLVAIIFGPFVASVVSMIVLTFQALLLAHGGITTLGANTFSMGVMGPIVSYIIFKFLKDKNKKLGVFLAAMLGDLTTYCVTAFQLALAIPDKSGGVIFAFEKFLGVFALTQVPLAFIEGIVTVMIFQFIEKHSPKEIKETNGGVSYEK